MTLFSNQIALRGLDAILIVCSFRNAHIGFKPFRTNQVPLIVANIILNLQQIPINLILAVVALNSLNFLYTPADTSKSDPPRPDFPQSIVSLYCLPSPSRLYHSAIQ